MGIKKHEINELKTKVKKLDFDTILNNKSIKEEIPILSGTISGTPTKTYDYIVSVLKSNSKEIDDQMKNKINELITEDMLESINETIQAHIKKTNIEKMIATMKLRAKAMNGTSIVEEIDKMKLELDIEVKEEEFKEYNKKFLELYLKALGNTLIPIELSDLYDQVCHIKTDILEDISEEIALCRAKIETLTMMYRAADTLEDTDSMITERINISSVSKQVIQSSARQVPLIKVLIK